MLTRESLIEKGYFPREAIPPLSPSELAAVLPKALPNLNDCLRKARTSKCCSYSIPRAGGFRRVLGIPNPLHQIQLSKTIANDWASIAKHFAKSTISLSIPVVDAKSERAIVPHRGFDALTEERILRSTSSRYLLRADVARFYRSIYTHSIPWALHTKRVAKANRKSNLLGNRIDKAIRNTCDGQTVGIPIGPDTSRIVSEIVGVSIDTALRSEIKALKGARFVDDVYLYFGSLDSLARGHSALQRVLEDFELELNVSKTEKVELPESWDSRWVLEIRGFQFRRGKTTQRNDLISYFDLAYQHAKANPSDHVLDYAVAKVKGQPIHPDNWRIFEALLLKTTIAETKILPSTLRLLLYYRGKGYKLGRRRIRNTIERLLVYHCALHHSFEVSWMLWFYKSLRLRPGPGDKAMKGVSQTDNSVVALAALDLEASGLTTRKFDRDVWEKCLNADGLYSENWLLSYEAYVKGWLKRPPSAAKYVESDPFFHILQSNDVEFYDDGRQVRVGDLVALRREISGEASLMDDFDFLETGSPSDDENVSD